MSYDPVLKSGTLNEREWFDMSTSERFEWISEVHRELADLSDSLADKIDATLWSDR